MSSDAVVFIDWISYTRDNHGHKINTPEFDSLSREAAQEWLELTAVADVDEGYSVPVKPNKPFAHARMDSVSKSRIEWGGGSESVLISFSGEGCRVLRKNERLSWILSERTSGVTRIDLSVDIRTKTDPFEFSKARDKKRHKTGAIMFSEEGQTQYTGSWSSDRFARAYRYHAPHERSDFLRVEHVFKGKQAKRLAAALVKTSPENLISEMGSIYGWSHPDWLKATILAQSPERVDWYKAEKRSSKTLKWLEDTCCASIVRLVREGEITNLPEWLEEHVYDKLYSEAYDSVTEADVSGG